MGNSNKKYYAILTPDEYAHQGVTVFCAHPAECLYFNDYTPNNVFMEITARAKREPIFPTYYSGVITKSTRLSYEEFGERMGLREGINILQDTTYDLFCRVKNKTLHGLLTLGNCVYEENNSPFSRTASHMIISINYKNGLRDGVYFHKLKKIRGQFANDVPV